MVYKVSAEKVNVGISKELYERAKKYIEEQGGFNSVEELIEFLLDQVLGSEEIESAYTEEEEKEVKERLKALGYF